MSVLTRESLLSFEPKVVPVELPEGTTYVKQISEADFAEIQAQYVVNGQAKRNARTAQAAKVMWVIKCVCDESGNCLFQREDSVAVSEKIRAGAFELLYDKAVHVNEVNLEDDDEKKSDTQQENTS